MAQVWYAFAALCLFLSGTGQAQDLGEKDGCPEAFVKLTGQGLDQQSFDNGASYSGHLPDVSDEASCRQACCGHKECTLALLESTAGAPAECHLVSCLSAGRDVCVLTAKDGFTAFRAAPVDRAGSNSTANCLSPAVMGPCRAAFPRFYYSAANQTCLPFTYGGCEGNANNYETVEQCEAACSGVKAPAPADDKPSFSRRMAPVQQNADLPEGDGKTMPGDEYAEKCEAPVKVGLCRASIPRYFYNKTTHTCHLFIYGGCHGNQNNYLSEEECLASCQVSVIPVPKKTATDSSKEYHDSCLASPKVGPCRGAFPAFFFSPSTQDCLPFTYGGCQGNQNRYSSAQECLAHCVGSQGYHNGHGHRFTPAFIMATTLAIMTGLLVLALILLSLRKVRRRLHSRRDDKEELLPREDSSQKA
ncbi:kunitz-type protease inhibitor 2 isoform X1 [Lepisosteus oculatus]|uniref:kunitz-type protease inhibitor 2 isoform X1 n=1 Tax=Lepisosteus oculatus TaxID=7918 RepID=UPI0037169445